jgi:hypothetical protein
MKLLVLYRPVSEHARITEEFLHDLQSRHDGTKVETINIDSREGSTLASLYDVVEYPALLAVRDDGSVANSWTGPLLPLIGDVQAALRS